MTTGEKRIIIVTGAGIGIGAATAKAFGALGDHIVVTDILETEGLKQPARLLRPGARRSSASMTFAPPKRPTRLVADIEMRHGRIDVMVANAGIAHRTPLTAS